MRDPSPLYQTGSGDVHVQVSELAGRAVPQLVLLSLRSEMRAAATAVVVYQEGIPAHDMRSGVAVKDLALPLADVLLIVEDLLMRARQLADSGAPAEVFEAILDDVAALRDGRG
jgi:hypothetical protein